MSGPRLWGGRQSGALDPAFEAFNRSLPFDQRMVDEDLVGSAAWARALGKAGVLTAAEVKKLEKALATLRKRVAADPGLCERAADEDVHSFVERELGGPEPVEVNVERYSGMSARPHAAHRAPCD